MPQQTCEALARLHPYNLHRALLAARLITAGSRVAACFYGFLVAGRRCAVAFVAYPAKDACVRPVALTGWMVVTGGGADSHPTFRVPVFSKTSFM